MEQLLINLLENEAAGIGITLGVPELEQFALFYDEFLIWNAKMNLTAVEAGPAFVVRHFIDSLLVMPLIPPSAKTLLDLGTGGGFPGLPLSIVFRNLQVTLLDASRKKTSFLRQVLIKLGRSDVRVIAGRAEDPHGHGHGEGKYDVVISRATFKLSQLLTLASRYTGDDGVIIAMKGREWRKEIEEAESVGATHHLQLADVRETVLPRYGIAVPSWFIRGLDGFASPDSAHRYGCLFCRGGTEQAAGIGRQGCGDWRHG